MRFIFSITTWLAVFLPWGAVARADFADDLARIHLEAIGGKKHVLELRSLKATGVTKIRGEELSFVMWAARPMCVRTETTADGRVLTQGYDGVNPPWVMDSRTGKIQEMNAVAARGFGAEASFDDPLVLKGKRGVSLDYAGEAEIDGKPVFKLLVTENFTQTSFLYLDAATYMIVRREVEKPGAKGLEKVETLYGDYSPVNGVMLPYRIIEKAGGQVRSETVLTQIEANPPLAEGLFSRPVVAAKP